MAQSNGSTTQAAMSSQNQQHGTVARLLPIRIIGQDAYRIVSRAKHGVTSLLSTSRGSRFLYTALSRRSAKVVLCVGRFRRLCMSLMWDQCDSPTSWATWLPSSNPSANAGRMADEGSGYVAQVRSCNSRSFCCSVTFRRHRRWPSSGRPGSLWRSGQHGIGPARIAGAARAGGRRRRRPRPAT